MGGEGGATSLLEANRDVPLDGVAFSRLDWLSWGTSHFQWSSVLEWGRTFSDLWLKTVLHIYGYSKRTRSFVLWMKM